MRKQLLFLIYFLLLVIIGILIGGFSFSRVDASDWFCTQESSQHVDDEIHTCGVASAYDINTARLLAFDNARAEFTKLCESSHDCIGHSVNITPMRTECYPINSSIQRCYRMLSFKVLPKTEDSCTSDNCPSPHDSPKKITIGMGKDELLRLYGQPDAVYHINTFEDRKLQYFYKGEYCTADSCYIIITHNKVEEVVRFKFDYFEE